MSEDENIYQLGEDQASVALYDHLSDEIDAFRHRLTPFTIMGILDRVRYDFHAQIDNEDEEQD
jgi:hypothetical protein